MVISHKHKYLFIEIPHTASTAIHKELCDNYDGSPILRKHALYSEFQKIASPEEKTYFVFAGMRNPLDDAVTLYYKYKTNHKERYTDPKRLAQGRGNVTRDDMRRFSFIAENDADFATYFRKLYKSPYCNVMLSLASKHCDFIMRFENLQDDFSKAIGLIGTEQKRPLPRINWTGEKKDDYLSCYTPEIIEQVKRVFGPCMKRWGYDFPPEWGDNSISWLSQIEFHTALIVKSLYWNYLRKSPRLYGRLIRQVR